MRLTLKDINMSLKNLKSFIRKVFPAKKASPKILIYQMGKVGGSSINYSLNKYGLNGVYKVHRMNQENIKSVKINYIQNGMKPVLEPGEWLYPKLVKVKQKIKIITLIREPIARNLSAFFQNYKLFLGKEYSEGQFNLQHLIETFINKYDHQVPLEWFDKEFKSVLNINVYNHDFNWNKGFINISTDKYESLILKCEISDSRKEKAIENFLKIENFNIQNANIGEKKVYSNDYKNFVKYIKLPVTYIDNMCNSKYMKHFYSNKEIDSIRERWSKD